MSTQAAARKPIWTRWWFIALVALVALGALLQALGGGSPEAAAPASTPAATSAAPEPEPSETGPRTELGLECLAVSEEVANHVMWAVDEEATPSAAAAVKVPKADSYVVAIRISGGVLDGDHAIFETMNIETSSILLGIDGTAHQFTDFPHSALSLVDDPSEAALACME